MLALGFRYLNGFVAASEPDAHERAEWPPHPGRVFMALGAAHFVTGGDPLERMALEWLERLPAPRVHAGEALRRAVVGHYVPVNDKAGDRKKPPTAVIQAAPTLTRDRQLRSFARAWIDPEVTYLSWVDVVVPPGMRQALAGLCAKVTRIGHSTSLVHMWLASPEELPEPSWVPDPARAEIHLRVPSPGTLEYLASCYNAEEVERWAALALAAYEEDDAAGAGAAREALRKRFRKGPPQRRRPELRMYEGYARPQGERLRATAPGTVFSPHVVPWTLRREAGCYRELDLPSVPHVVQGWRRAILAQLDNAPEKLRTVLSGHHADGTPVNGPHVAFVPFAFVGHPHADGHLLGMGLALPAHTPPEDRRGVLRVFARVQRLTLGRLGVWSVEGVSVAERLWNLQAPTWTAYPQGATCWSTVTPIVFDRHPKETEHRAYLGAVAAMIKDGCVRLGLPRPRHVIVTGVSAHVGVPPARAFPRLQRKDGSLRRHTHAILVFDEPVCGPLLLGAGRYRGYGACRPLDGIST